ncbi:N-acyl-D-amino-acid deacylase family protein [Abyssisolibacter fermentans]|uniref:N-acyl-D-amino-acid deacylase family protein n=1 Tax=Abyssisolibacter fermentans TaxID=1766203 RepID=UPI000833A107|nr:amidohydrolase family protein [Abyssisolibacter fermentans]
MYDILIKNAKIYDGSGQSAFIGNILVKNDKIVEIGNCTGEAIRVIDANGLCAAPGIIDAHTHDDNNVIHNKQMASALYQGVTTEVTGMCGLGQIPSKKEDIPDILRMYAGIVEYKENSPFYYTNVDEYLSLADGAAINVASSVNHCALRIFAGGFKSTKYEDIAEVMKDELRKNLRMGAVGFSIGLDYFPAHSDVVSTQELIDLCKVAKEENALMFSHVRPGGKGIDPLEEMEIVARESGAKVHILHTKTFHPSSSGHPEYITDRFDKANAEGASVTLEFYPYPGWETLGLYYIPFWAIEGGYDALMERLGNPKLRERLAAEIEENYNYLMGDDVPAICSFARYHESYEGITFDEICELRKQPMGEMILDVMYETKLGFGALSSDIKDQTIYKQIQDDYMTLFKSSYYTVSSDSIIVGTFPHPRVFGTFAKIMRLTREYNMSLEHTIYKLTKFVADRYSFADRGHLAVGKAADIMIFNYDKVEDCSNYKNPRLPAKGMEYVIVNGRIALEQGKPNGIFAGKALRRAGC